MRSRLIIFFLFLVVRASALDLTIKVDSLGVVNCCVKGDFVGRLAVEQFRWNRWVVMYSFGGIEYWKDSCVQTRLFLHSGVNQFRLAAVPANPYIDVICSKVVTIGDPADTSGCGFARVCEPSDRITLKRPSYWQIHDENDSYVKVGTSRVIPIADLPKGRYVLYYDNCTAEFYRQ